MIEKLRPFFEEEARAREMAGRKEGGGDKRSKKAKEAKNAGGKVSHQRKEKEQPGGKLSHQAKKEQPSGKLSRKAKKKKKKRVTDELGKSVARIRAARRRGRR